MKFSIYLLLPTLSACGWDNQSFGRLYEFSKPWRELGVVAPQMQKVSQVLGGDWDRLCIATDADDPKNLESMLGRDLSILEWARWELNLLIPDSGIRLLYEKNGVIKKIEWAGAGYDGYGCYKFDTLYIKKGSRIPGDRLTWYAHFLVVPAQH